MTRDEAFNRGVRDAVRDRGALFRRVGKWIESNVDDPQADDWTPEQREAYLEGYDSESR